MKFDKNDFKIFEIVVDSDEFDIGLVGVPYDGATRGRPGARFAPKFIRERLFGANTYCLEYGTDLSNIKIRDFGDLDVHVRSLDLARSKIYRFFEEKKTLGRGWIILGGDHSITKPVFEGFSCNNGQKFGLIIFDAHFDLRELGGEYVSSGTVVADILSGCSKISPDKIVQIGLRGFVNSKYYVEKAGKLGINFYTSSDVKKFGILNILDDALSLLGDVDKIYVSLDLDSLDIAFAPGVNAPSSGGLYPNEIYEALFALGENKKVFALDIVEYAPPYDVANMTLEIAVNSILYFLAGFTNR